MVRLLAYYAFMIWFCRQFKDKCPRCGEPCTPIEADGLWGTSCWDCEDVDSYRKEIARG